MCFAEEKGSSNTLERIAQNQCVSRYHDREEQDLQKKTRALRILYCRTSRVSTRRYGCFGGEDESARAFFVPIKSTKSTSKRNTYIRKMLLDLEEFRHHTKTTPKRVSIRLLWEFFIRRPLRLSHAFPNIVVLVQRFTLDLFLSIREQAWIKNDSIGKAASPAQHRITTEQHLLRCCLLGRCRPLVRCTTLLALEFHASPPVLLHPLFVDGSSEKLGGGQRHGFSCVNDGCAHAPCLVLSVDESQVSAVSAAPRLRTKRAKGQTNRFQPAVDDSHLRDQTPTTALLTVHGRCTLNYLHLVSPYYPVRAEEPYHGRFDVFPCALSELLPLCVFNVGELRLQ